MKTKIVLFVSLLILCLPGVAQASEPSFLSDPSKWVVDLPGGSGSRLVQVEVQNISSEARTYNVEYWNYRIPEFPGDPEWITSVNPNDILLPPGGKGIFNISLSIPEDTPHEKYTMYVKVTDDIESVKRPIPIVIRVGEAVPSYEYNVSPGIYNVSVTGDGEITRHFNIRVNNTGTVDSTYEIFPRLPDSPETIDPKFETGELGWLNIGEGMFKAEAGGAGSTSYSLTIPENVPTGKYKVWVGVRDVEAAGAVQIQYAVKMLIQVARSTEPRGSLFPFWVPIVSIGSLVVFGYGFSKYRKWRRRTDKVG